MTPTDLKILCTALGFTAVAMQSDDPLHKENARRATVLARLIEEFCRVTVPHAFGAEEGTGDDMDTQEIDELIENFRVARTAKRNS